jgi:hypothetical protein
MSIKFFCSCGKHLRAREALAGKRSVCPQCGQLVGVPSLQATHRGTVPAPMTPAEKGKLKPRDVIPIPAPDSLAAAAQDVFEFGSPEARTDDGKLQPRRRSRRLLALEKHWYQCLLFPFYAWHMVIGLSFGLTILSGIFVIAVPEFGSLPATWWVWLIVWAAPFVVFGYVCGFLQCVLGSAAAGETGFVRWPGFDMGLIVRALLAWIICFLMGPIVFAAAAFWFWLHAGDPKFIDWLIIIELGLAGTTHWLLTLVAVHQGDQLRDANPARVAELIRRLGYRTVLATLAASGVGLSIGWAILQALGELHDGSPLSWFLLALGWLLGVMWLTFFFRLLGLWCFQSRVEAVPMSAAQAIAPDRTANTAPI